MTVEAETVQSGSRDPTMWFISLVVAATAVVLAWLIRQTQQKQSTNVRKEPPPVPKKQSNKAVAKDKKAGGRTKRVPSAPTPQFTHPELLTSLKGHSGLITSGGFSSDGKHFITAAEDRTVQIWAIHDFQKKDHRSSRGNIDFDHAIHVCWSPDGKAFLVQKAVANTIEVYKVSRKPDGMLGNVQVAMTFPQHDEEADVIAMDVAVTGKYIMTCNNKNQLVIWSLRGDILESVDTRHGETYSVTLSPCGRFIATTGFTPDVKVWEVKFNKSGSFESVKRAYDLVGHKAGIYSCSINCDSTRMVSVSKDGTWKLFDTNVEWEKGQQVYLLRTVKYEGIENPSMIRLAPDGRSVVIAAGANLKFYSAITGDELNSISDIYAGNIVDMMFDPSSKLLLTLGDRHVRVFHNVAGYKSTIEDLQNSRQKAMNNAMRERIAKQISDAKTALEKIMKMTQGDK